MSQRGKRIYYLLSWQDWVFRYSLLCRLNPLFSEELWTLWGGRTEHWDSKALMNFSWNYLPYCEGKRMYSQLRVLMNFCRKEDNWGAICSFPLAMNLSTGSQLNLKFSSQGWTKKTLGKSKSPWGKSPSLCIRKVGEHQGREFTRPKKEALCKHWGPEG